MNLIVPEEIERKSAQPEEPAKEFKLAFDTARQQTTTEQVRLRLAEEEQRKKDAEEDAFLKELRALAGMDPVEPAAPKPQPAAAQPAPQPAPAKKSVEGDTKKINLRVKEEPARQPVRERTPAPERPAAPARRERQTVQDDAVVPGWIKGLAVLVASAAILALTVIGVANGLQTVVF